MALFLTCEIAIECYTLNVGSTDFSMLTLWSPSRCGVPVGVCMWGPSYPQLQENNQRECRQESVPQTPGKTGNWVFCDFI